MATTYTTNVRLQMPATSDRHWDVLLNANARYLDSLNALGGLAVTTLETPSASLSCRISAGTFVKSNGMLVTFGGTASLALPVSATSFVWLTDSGLPGVGSVYPTTPYVPLAQVTTVATTILQINDTRAAYQSVVANTVFVAKAGDTISGPLQVVSPSTGTAVLSLDPVNLLIGFFGVTPATQAAKITAMTDSTGGTPGGTLTNVGSTFSQATLNNNFASLTATVNALVAAFKRHGLMSS
jgi:hypothetical protein